MSGQNLVIVESPAKAKTIEKYLGDGYTVLASFGHIRDLPPKDGSVRPEDDFAMDWELDAKARKRVEEIARAAKESDTIFLATDPDREGEAISWHVQEVLKAKKGLARTPFHRVTFNEITKSAVLDAIANPRRLNDYLIEAYLARRALDYLVGFTLSPVLWRKLPGAKSAGRVQSVALRLIAEREAEIEAFEPREYWSIEAVLESPSGERFTARLTHFEGKKLERFDIADKQRAEAIVARLQDQALAVANVERKEVRRNPAPPFTTSTLQQEASRKLGFGASRTMRIAQKLYEGITLGGETVGLITYMRTDGTQIAGEAIGRTREIIARDHGDRYLPAQPRVYKTKAKNAQEAHEAIRPTDAGRHPREMARYLSEEDARLYELIWKRLVACQMASAVLDQVAVDIDTADGAGRFRATGSIVKFDGFLTLYQEGRDDSEEDENNRRLPPLNQGDALAAGEITPNQHFTQPPPRYTEASLVKRMEELGIGRPSTYASIIQVLQDRDYVRLESRRFVPEDRGRLVTSFLSSFFERYVEYDFTAKLEEQLDEISDGKIDWKRVLSDFWQAFQKAVEGTKDLSIGQVIEALDEDLGRHFFRPGPNGEDPRRCPGCGDGRLSLRLGRNGAFIGCSNYPDCTYTRPLEVVTEENADAAQAYPRALGSDPESGETVTVRKGPYGFYVQLGEAEKGRKPGPKRSSLPRGYDPATISLERALALLALPKELGSHPDSGKPIVAGIGRYGPYLQHDGAYTSVPKDEDVLDIGMNRAVELIANSKPRKAAQALKVLGTPKGSKQEIAVFKGRYGPYVKQGRTMASLPKGKEVDDLTLEEAVTLIAAKSGSKAGKGGRKGGRSAKSGKAAAKGD